MGGDARSAAAGLAVVTSRRAATLCMGVGGLICTNPPGSRLRNSQTGGPPVSSPPREEGSESEGAVFALCPRAAALPPSRAPRRSPNACSAAACSPASCGRASGPTRSTVTSRGRQSTGRAPPTDSFPPTPRAASAASTCRPCNGLVGLILGGSIGAPSSWPWAERLLLLFVLRLQLASAVDSLNAAPRRGRAHQARRRVDTMFSDASTLAVTLEGCAAVVGCGGSRGHGGGCAAMLLRHRRAQARGECCGGRCDKEGTCRRCLRPA